MQIDWLTVAAQIVNFLVLVWLLQRFLYRPIVSAMAERENRIETRLTATWVRASLASASRVSIRFSRSAMADTIGR